MPDPEPVPGIVRVDNLRADIKPKLLALWFGKIGLVKRVQKVLAENSKISKTNKIQNLRCNLVDEV